MPRLIYLINRYQLVLLLLIYLVLGLYLINFYQYQINTDGTALLSIAYAIKAGDFKEAINSHWGVIFPMILSSFLFLRNFQPNFLFKLSQLTIGFFAVITSFLLTRNLNLDKVTGFLLRLALIPVVLYFAFSTNTVDLLVATLVILYLAICLNRRLFQSYKQAALLGLVAGLLSLTKEYYLYFFLLHFSVISLLHYFKSKQKQVVKVYILAVAITVLISIFWGLILTTKYHRFMLGSRGSVSLKMVNPFDSANPLFTEGLIPPPGKYGISAWDEPVFLNFKPWSPLESGRQFLNLVERNLITLLTVYRNFSPVFIPVVVGALLYFLYSAYRKYIAHEFIYLFITFLLLPVGYIAIAVEPRYIWANYLLGAVMGTILLVTVSEKYHLRRPFYVVVLLVFLGLYIKPAVDYLRYYRFIDHTFYDQAKFLNQFFGIKSQKLAANKNWHQTLYISTYYNNKFYGVLKPGDTYTAALTELRKNQIDYFFIWEDAPYLKEFQQYFPELKQTEIQNLHIINLK